MASDYEEGERPMESNESEVSGGVADAVARSWSAVDHSDGSQIHEGYLPGAVFSTPAVRLEGHEQLQAGHLARHANGRRLSRHLISNLIVQHASDGTARATYVVTLYSGTGQPPQELTGAQAVCDLVDHWTKTAEGWKIASRELTPVFVSADNDSVMLGGAR